MPPRAVIEFDAAAMHSDVILSRRRTAKNLRRQRLWQKQRILRSFAVLRQLWMTGGASGRALFEVPSRPQTSKALE